MKYPGMSWRVSARHAKAEMDVAYYQSIISQAQNLRPNSMRFLQKRQIEVAEGGKGQSYLRQEFGTPCRETAQLRKPEGRNAQFYES